MRWQTREIRPIDVPVEQDRPSASRRLLLGFPQTRSRWTLCSRCTACWCAAAPHAALLPGLPRARFDTVALVALFALPSSLRRILTSQSRFLQLGVRSLSPCGHAAFSEARGPRWHTVGKGYVAHSQLGEVELGRRR